MLELTDVMMKEGEQTTNSVVAVEKDQRTWANTMLP
jgi:hypothetical protein